MKPVKRSVEGPTLNQRVTHTNTDGAAPIKFVCILLKKEATVRRASKVSRRRERESEDGKSKEKRQRGETNDEKQRWDRKCASGRNRGRDVEKRREKEKKKRRKVGGDGERFHEESGWLTDDLIKRGTNYRPAGC